MVTSAATPNSAVATTVAGNSLRCESPRRDEQRGERRQRERGEERCAVPSASRAGDDGEQRRRGRGERGQPQPGPGRRCRSVTG